MYYRSLVDFEPQIFETNTIGKISESVLSGMSDIYIYIYLLYEIFEKQSDSTDAQQQEAPVDESREVVEARTPGEQTIPRTMTSVRRKDGPRLKEILV